MKHGRVWGSWCQLPRPVVLRLKLGVCTVQGTPCPVPYFLLQCFHLDRPLGKRTKQTEQTHNLPTRACEETREGSVQCGRKTTLADVLAWKNRVPNLDGQLDGWLDEAREAPGRLPLQAAIAFVAPEDGEGRGKREEERGETIVKVVYARATPPSGGRPGGGWPSGSERPHSLPVC